MRGRTRVRGHGQGRDQRVQGVPGIHAILVNNALGQACGDQQQQGAEGETQREVFELDALVIGRFGQACLEVVEPGIRLGDSPPRPTT